jgi:hypothetical protein
MGLTPFHHPAKTNENIQLERVNGASGGMIITTIALAISYPTIIRMRFFRAALASASDEI